MKKFFFLPVLILVLFVSCKKTDTSSSTACTGTSIGEFTFLKDGSKLTYDFQSLFGTDDTVVLSFTATSHPGVFLQKLNDITSSTILEQVYTRECNGWLLNDKNTNPADSEKYVKETTVVGDTWRYFDPQSQNYGDYTVIKKNVSVTVSAGTFTCDKLIFNEEGTINTDTVYWNNTYNIIKYDGLLVSYSLINKNY